MPRRDNASPAQRKLCHPSPPPNLWRLQTTSSLAQYALYFFPTSAHVCVALACRRRLRQRSVGVKTTKNGPARAVPVQNQCSLRTVQSASRTVPVQHQRSTRRGRIPVHKTCSTRPGRIAYQDSVNTIPLPWKTTIFRIGLWTDAPK